MLRTQSGWWVFRRSWAGLSALALAAAVTVAAAGGQDVPGPFTTASALAAEADLTTATLDEEVTILIGGKPVQGSVTNRGPVQVALQSPFTNGLVFYTLSHTAETLGLLYDGPFTVRRTAVLRATAINSTLSQFVEATLNVIIQPSLTVTTDGGGAVAVSPPEGPWPEDLVASVAATPMQGWTFLAWLGDSSDTNASVVVSMNRDLSLKAVFGTTLSVAPVGSGRVLADPSTTFVPYGSTVRLTALSQPGSYFVGWGGAASGNSNPIEVVASNANPSVSALFGALPDGDRTLTVTAHGHGHVTISSNAPYYANGTGLVLTAVPEPGQSFLSWSGDGSGSFSTLSVTLTTNKIILADFTARPQLQVSPLGGMLPQGFRASFVGQVGTGYRVLASTNLVTWDIIGAATNTLGTVQFNDPQATNQSARFYRAEVVP